MSEFDKVTIFGTTTLSDVFKNIADNHKKTEKQIAELIQALKPFINTPGEAVMIVPLIKEYLEVKVKNDEQLVKMAGIVQRAMQSNKKSNENDFMLSESELNQIYTEIQVIGDSQEKATTKLISTEKKGNN